MVPARRLHRAALDLGEPRSGLGRAFHRHRPRDLRATGPPARRAGVIGARVRRVEDSRFLTGSGRFIDDVFFPGMLHCVLVRSLHPHARVRKITFPKEILVLTGRDMQKDGVRPMRAAWTIAGMVEPPRWALAWETVRHVGEPVAAVFAESKSLAEDAAEQVRI